jgi:dipeptidyl aminopeptidase/acylaminoacyl peptidase
VGRDGVETLLDPSLSGTFRAPAISPGGRKIAFQYNARRETEQHIWIYDLDQRTYSRLTSDGSNFDPFWSPDGLEVGFSSQRDGRAALYSRPVDSSREARLLRADPEAELREGSWTPDGRRLVYRRDDQVSSDIWHSAPDPDSTAVAIVGTPAFVLNPALSPDGRWLAYASDEEEGQTEIYLRPFPGPAGRTKVSTDGGINPVWGHSGSELLYLDRGPGGTPVSWTESRLHLDLIPLIESRNEPFPFRGIYWKGARIRSWVLSPDDQRILAIGELGESSGDEVDWHVVVENFGEELKRLAPIQ